MEAIGRTTALIFEDCVQAVIYGGTMALRRVDINSLHNRTKTQRSPSFLYGRAFFGGIIGAFIMTLLMGLGIWMQWSPLSLEMLLGSILTGTTNAGTWMLGFFWHLINGGVFALAYAAIFQAAGRASPASGALIGVGHWLAAGILIPLIQLIHPLLIPTDSAIDYFVWTFWGRMTFFGALILHLVYGAIVGAVCQNALRDRRYLTGEGELKKEQQVA